MYYKPEKPIRGKGAVCREDLTDLVTRPLARELSALRDELIAKIKEVDESVTILARQKARDLDQARMRQRDI